MEREQYVCLVLREILDERKLSTVCGYNYVIGYADWQSRFEAGPLFSGY